jgi:putative DNA primase/helicase
MGNAALNKGFTVMKKQKAVNEQSSVFSPLDAALKYAEDGFSVLPLVAKQKYPLPGTHGSKEATTDKKVIKKTFKNKELNIGVATGEISAFFVLDIDGEDGEASLNKLTDEFGELPSTVEIKTGKGRHLLFQIPDGKCIKNSTSQVGKNIDIRGDGGYVVVPPSIHPNGNRYEGDIDRKNISEAPTWLISKILWKKKAKSAKGSDDIPEGTRNDTLFSECVKMRRKGQDEGKAFSALLNMNIERCKPPLEDTELERIVKSAYSIDLEETLEPFWGTTAEQQGLTDLGNSLRLVDRLDGQYTYCAPFGGWQIFKEGRWETDKNNSVVEEVKQSTIDFVSEAEAVKDPVIRKKYLDFACSSQSNAKISAALKLACSALSVSTDAFDADPTMVNLGNGVLDLQNEEFIEEHLPEQMLRKQTSVDFIEEAECPRWDQFLEEVTGGDQELIKYIQTVVGYCLTAETSERCLFILYGNGANGKTTFLNMIQQLLGDYAMTTPADTLMVKKAGGIPNDVARLCGARLVVASEIEEGQSLAEALVKRLTGQDDVVARFLNQEFFQFKPAFKIFIASNYIPRISGCDEGIWDRIRLLPFEVRIPEEKRDPELASKLQEELPGILNWAIDGYFNWIEQGLVTPGAVDVATQKYRSEMDVLGSFLDAKVIRKDGDRIQSRQLYQQYGEYCRENGERSESQKSFSLNLKNRGFISKKMQGRYFWLDVEVTNGRVFSNDGFIPI